MIKKPIVKTIASNFWIGVLGSLLPGLGTWFHICQLILSWNLSPRYFQLDGNEILLILALVDIVPQILPWNLKKTHFQLEGNEILLILALVDICPSDSTLKFEKNTFSARGQWNFINFGSRWHLSLRFYPEIWKNTFSARGQWNFINFSSRWHLSLQNQGNVAKMNWIPVQHRRTKAISAFSWLHQLPSCPSPSNNIALGFGFGQLHRKKPTPTNRQHKFPLLESFGAPDSDLILSLTQTLTFQSSSQSETCDKPKKTHNFAVLNARKERTSSQNSKL